MVCKRECGIEQAHCFITCLLGPIEVGYDPDLYVITESAGSVDLTIRVFSHPGGAPRPFSLLVNTEDGTASMSETIMIITSLKHRCC